MNLTQYGRIEVDPLRIPAAASMAPAQGERFADVLDQAASPEAVPEPATAVAEEPSSDVENVAGTDAGPDETREAAEPSPEPQGEPTVAQPTVTEALAVTVPTASNHRGEPELRIDAGKDSGSPRSPARAPLDLADTLAARRVQASATGALTGVPGLTSSAGATTAAPADARTAVGGPAGVGKTGVTARPAAATGYRTLNEHAVRMVEQARDSVFKQILFQLNSDGGEMRIRLEPPDLGELDLRVVVENGNQLRLSIAAERPELAQMLQRDLAQLKATLQANGLAVTHADVRTGTDAGRHGQDQGRGHHGGQAHRDAIEAADGPSPRLFSSANGLDFWV